jgi:hypothetical protein
MEELEVVNGPSPRYNHGMVAIEANIWMFGGMLANGLKNKEFWKYDTECNFWELITSEGEVPEARSGHGMVPSEKENRMFVFGGRTKEKAEGDLNDLWEYDIALRSWQKFNYTETLKPVKMTWHHIGLMSAVVKKF